MQFSSSPSSDNWFKPVEEGQLSLDVFREGAELVVRSLVAGVAPEALDISVNDDLLTIRGKRNMSKDIAAEDWYYHECYWGGFSRSLVLPHDVSIEGAQASMTNGVLEIRLPIQERGGAKIKVRLKE